MDCVFCSIVAEDLSAHRLYEDGDTLAITPQVVGGRPPVRAREFHDRPRI